MDISRDRQLGVLVAGLLSISVFAFVGQVYGLFDMGFVLAFFGLPATVLSIGLARWAVHAGHRVFYRRLLLGLAFGAAATASYDLIRLIIQTVFPLHFNAFAIHPRFGELIIHQPHTTTAAIVVGWAYHFSNGLDFALVYTLVTGRVRWWYGLIYALALQTAMVSMYPTAFGVNTAGHSFLIVSFTGHAVYGAVLGLLNQRYNISETRRRRRSKPRPTPGRRGAVPTVAVAAAEPASTPMPAAVVVNGVQATAGAANDMHNLEEQVAAVAREGQ